MNIDQPLIFDNYGKAHYSKKTKNGQTIEVEVIDMSVQMGPGTWNAIHTLAFYANNKEARTASVYAIKTICRKFPCKMCRRHARLYFKEHPIDEEHLFKWTWKFHNDVNKRLNKPTMSYDMAYELYKNTNQQ